jgi:hypothetical protein
MSRRILACGLVSLITLAGCAGASKQSFNERASAAPTPSWGKYSVAGSRIPRALDAKGQPLTGSHIVTITEEDLQSSSGVLLGDKLSGGYSSR